MLVIKSGAEGLKGRALFLTLPHEKATLQWSKMEEEWVTYDLHLPFEEKLDSKDIILF